MKRLLINEDERSLIQEVYTMYTTGTGDINEYVSNVLGFNVTIEISEPVAVPAFDPDGERAKGFGLLVNAVVRREGSKELLILVCSIDPEDNVRGCRAYSVHTKSVKTACMHKIPGITQEELRYLKKGYKLFNEVGEGDVLDREMVKVINPIYGALEVTWAKDMMYTIPFGPDNQKVRGVGMVVLAIAAVEKSDKLTLNVGIIDADNSLIRGYVYNIVPDFHIPGY
jgi:hypothetical protein